VEVALGRCVDILAIDLQFVSILVFVEVALGLVFRKNPLKLSQNVSILVFVEVALGPLISST